MKKRVGENGVPVEPDVKKLEEAFQTDSLYPGRRLGHYQLSEIIGHAYGSNRYVSVTVAWRKKMRKLDPPIYLEFDRGDYGFGCRVLDDPGKFRHTKLKAEKARRRTREARRVSENVDRRGLSVAEQAQFDKVVDKVNRMIASHTLKGKPSKKMEKGFDLAPKYTKRVEHEAATAAA